MKKFTKTVLIIICVLTVVGGLMTGGIYALHKLSSSDAFKGPDTFKNVFENDVTSIDCRFSYAGLQLVEGSSWSVAFDNIYRDDVTMNIDNGILTVIIETENDMEMSGWKTGFGLAYKIPSEQLVTITYPEGTSFENVNVQLGRGNCNLGNIDVSNLVCQLALGKCSMKNAVVRNIGGIQLGLGWFKSENTCFRNTEINLGVGYCDVETDESTHESDVDISVGLGLRNII